MTSKENASTLWVCYDCANADANGAPDPEGVETWSLPLGGQVSAGTLEHDSECEYGGGELDCDYVGCEIENFSWSPCDGCGSGLGGERFAYTLWTVAA